MLGAQQVTNPHSPQLFLPLLHSYSLNITNINLKHARIDQRNNAKSTGKLFNVYTPLSHKRLYKGALSLSVYSLHFKDFCWFPEIPGILENITLHSPVLVQNQDQAVAFTYMLLKVCKCVCVCWGVL